MKVRLRVNGKVSEIKKADFDKFSDDQKLRYDIIDKTDSVSKNDQVVSNEAAKGADKK